MLRTARSRQSAERHARLHAVAQPSVADKPALIPGRSHPMPRGGEVKRRRTGESVNYNDIVNKISVLPNKCFATKYDTTLIITYH